MNFRVLALDEMVPLTAEWLEGQRQLFLSLPEIAGMIAQVEKVHHQAVEMLEISKGDELAAELTHQLALLDSRHDNVLRALWWTLSASIEALRAEDPPATEQADRLEAVRDRLMPERLSYLIRSYLEEAANAQRALSQLDAHTEAILREVPLYGGRNALELVRQWGRLGLELGQLERRRTRLQDRPEHPLTDLQVRSAWIQVVSLVLSSLELCDAPPGAVATLRQPLLDAVAAAERRAAERAQEPAQRERSAPEEASSEGVRGGPRVAPAVRIGAGPRQLERLEGCPT